MKKLLLSSLFLIGTFALANEKNLEDETRNCTTLANTCGAVIYVCWDGDFDPERASDIVRTTCKELEEQDDPGS